MHSRNLAAALLAVLLPVATFAVPVTYEFSGQITSSSYSHPQLFPNPLIPFQTAYTGFFTIETSTPAVFEGGDIRVYDDAILEGYIQFGEGGSLGGFLFFPDQLRPYAPFSSRLVLTNDAGGAGDPQPYDQFSLSFRLSSNLDDPLFSNRWLSIGAWDDTGSLLSAGSTLADGLPLEGISSSRRHLDFGITQYDGSYSQNLGDASVGGGFSLRRVTTPPDVSVPEPGTWGLMAVGLLGLLLSRRRVSAPAG